jgi:hypothetical protein
MVVDSTITAVRGPTQQVQKGSRTNAASILYDTRRKGNVHANQRGNERQPEIGGTGQEKRNARHTSGHACPSQTSGSKATGFGGTVMSLDSEIKDIIFRLQVLVDIQKRFYDRLLTMADFELPAFVLVHLMLERPRSSTRQQQHGVTIPQLVAKWHALQ